MTLYRDFRSATSGLSNQIKNFGHQVGSTRELIDVHYGVASPHLDDLDPHQPWADKEFEDRIAGEVRNPGNSWKELPEVWEPMKEPSGRYSYTYNERILFQRSGILHELGDNPNSREAYLSIWNSTADPFRLGVRRVPCTLGYQFLIREDKLNLIYLQRSCNFNKHFQDDIYLARKLQEWVANELGMAPGGYSHWIGSLHVFV